MPEPSSPPIGAMVPREPMPLLLSLTAGNFHLRYPRP